MIDMTLAKIGRSTKKWENRMPAVLNAKGIPPVQKVLYWPRAPGAAASILPSWAVTFWPGLARRRPSMTSRSVAASPDRMTRKPSTIGPSSISLVPTMPSSATVKMILLD
jgi:hypothetical protein